MRSQVRMILYGAFILALAFAAVPAAHATTVPTAAVAGPMSPNNFPGPDADFHTYAEMVSEINAVAAQYPSLVRVSVIGQSYEGRNLYAIKISDNVAVDEAEPEVLYNAHMHAREHITVEMALYLLNMFTGQYGTDSRVHSAVDRREIWILPDLNPDGGEFDISTGSYLFWRKNRQPNSGSTAVGTDINRNFGYQWGCCGGSSGDPASLVFRGPSAYSTPEAQAYRDFVHSRRIDGVQQIKAAIDFHSYSELVLWPYSYTTADTAPGLNADQQATFRAIGEQMAATNDYQARQASEGVGYLADGSSIDYLWGAEGIWAYTIEMFPKPDSGFGFYPPDEVIPAETARNRDAALLLAEYADCPYRAIGKTEQYCATPPPSVVTVPDVRGSTQAQARTALEAIGLVLGGVSFVVDTTCEWINVVKFQNPSAGNQVLLGSAVSVTIGTPPSTPCP